MTHGRKPNMPVVPALADKSRARDDAAPLRTVRAGSVVAVPVIRGSMQQARTGIGGSYGTARVVAGTPVAKKPSKYGNRKVTVGDITFDSAREGARFAQLRTMERAGLISDLKLQVPFELVPSVKFAGTDRAKRAMVYRADFVYQQDGKQVVEDVKGVATKEFQIKRHLMLALLGIDVKVTR